MEENENYEGFLNVNKSRKWKFLICSLLIIIAVGVGLYVGFNKLTSNPMLVYKMALNNFYNEIKEDFKNVKPQEFFIDALNEPFTINLNTKIATNQTELKLLENIKYDINIGFDYPKKQAMASLSLSDSNDPIIKVLGAIMNDSVYVKSDEIFDKVIKIGEYDVFDNLKEYSDNLDYSYKGNINEDIVEATKEIKNILIDSLDSKNFKISNAKIKVDNKNVKVKKVTYTLNKTDLENTLKDILTKVSDNSSILDVLAYVSSKPKTDLRESLDYLAKNLDLDLEKLVIDVYANTWNKVVKMDLFIDNEKLMVYEKENDDDKITIEMEDQTLEIIGNDKESTITLKELGEDVLKIIVDGDAQSLDIVFDYETTYLELKLDNMVNNENKSSQDFELSLSDSEENVKIDLEGSLSILKGEIEVVDTSNSILYTDISEKDMAKMSDNLNKLIEGLNLTNLFSEMI